jgi:hypothetical protein
LSARLFKREPGWLLPLLLALLCPLVGKTADYLSLTAEIEVVSWSGRTETPPYVRAHTYTARCIVGTNSWLLDGEFSENGRCADWFTGTNIVEHVSIAFPVA